jgi:hypothetical protein
LAPPTNFDTTRIRFGDLVAAISGLVLILSLFLEWYNVSAKSAFGSIGGGVSGWEALSFIDILLFVIGAVAIAIAVLRAMNTMPRSLPASPGLIVLAVGGLGVLLVLFRLVSIPDHGVGSLPGVDVGRSFGVFLAFLAAAGVTVGGWLTWNEEGKPKPGALAGGAGSAPIGQGQPPAGQPGYTQPQQGYAQPQAAAGTPPQAAAPPAAAPGQQAAPAGAAAKADWYPDPRGEKRLRYWDGSQWTDHTAD